MDCFECDKELIAVAYARIVGGNKVWLCGTCERITPENKGGN